MSFLEKFRGKTQLMGKEGVSSLIHESSKPIPKSNSKRNFSSQSEKLKPIFATNEFLSAKKKYENYSDKKPPVFATNEFIKRDKPDDTQSEQISTKPLFSHKKLSLKPEKQKIPVLMKRKDFISIDRGIKENKYNSNVNIVNLVNKNYYNYLFIRKKKFAKM